MSIDHCFVYVLSANFGSMSFCYCPVKLGIDVSVLSSSTVMLKSFIFLLKVMKKSVLTPDFEKRHEILPYTESRRQVKKQRQVELFTWYPL